MINAFIFGTDCSSGLLELRDSEYDIAVQKMKNYVPDDFFQYFIRYKFDQIKNGMIKTFQEQVNLDEKGVTTNDIESFNALLKRYTNGEFNPDVFISKLQEIIIEQEVNYMLARAGCGKYTLKDEYKELRVGTVDVFEKSLFQTIASKRASEKSVEISSQFENFCKDLNLSNAYQCALRIRIQEILSSKNAILPQTVSNNLFFVKSNSDSNYYQVNFENLKNLCNCEGFQKNKLCSHIFSVCEMKPNYYDIIKKLIENNPPRFFTKTPKPGGKSGRKRKIRKRIKKDKLSNRKSILEVLNLIEENSDYNNEDNDEDSSYEKPEENGEDECDLTDEDNNEDSSYEEPEDNNEDNCDDNKEDNGDDNSCKNNGSNIDGDDDFRIEINDETDEHKTEIRKRNRKQKRKRKRIKL
jgi:hypothetical protein